MSRSKKPKASPTPLEDECIAALLVTEADTLTAAADKVAETLGASRRTVLRAYKVHNVAIDLPKSEFEHHPQVRTALDRFERTSRAEWRRAELVYYLRSRGLCEGIPTWRIIRAANRHFLGRKKPIAVSDIASRMALAAVSFGYSHFKEELTVLSKYAGLHQHAVASVLRNPMGASFESVLALLSASGLQIGLSAPNGDFIDLTNAVQRDAAIHQARELGYEGGL